MDNLITSLLASAENIFILAALFLTNVIAVLYGIIVILPRRKGIFYQMMVAGLGCSLISNFCYLISYWTGNSLMVDFEVGNLGEIGCFLFFLIANKSEYGDMIDDKRPEYAKYRKLSWIAPCLLLIEFLSFLKAGFSDGSMVRLIIFAIIAFILGYCGYYSLKYFLIPGEAGSVLYKKSSLYLYTERLYNQCQVYRL